MAYLSTAAHADNGDGRGGCGYLETHWHRMPDATVELLLAEDIRGDIEICWNVGFYDGVRADLSVNEARILRDRLTQAINEFCGIDNDVENPGTVNDAGVEEFEPEEFVFCRICGGRIWRVGSAPDWWMHEYEDRHTHNAVPAEPEEVHCVICNGQIVWVDSPSGGWWAHLVHPDDDHDAVTVQPGEVA